MSNFESISTYFFLRFVYYFQYFIDIREYINSHLNVEQVGKRIMRCEFTMPFPLFFFLTILLLLLQFSLILMDMTIR